MRFAVHMQAKNDGDVAVVLRVNIRTSALTRGESHDVRRAITKRLHKALRKVGFHPEDIAIR